MPNHCNNRLNVTPSDQSEDAISQFKDFRQKATRTDDDGEIQFTMNEIFPTPEELLEHDPRHGEPKNSMLMKKYGSCDWYAWRVENWGTKWDAYDTIIHTDIPEEFEVEYDTAWGPNTEFLLKATDIYPKLTFTLTYIEPGMAFCGKNVISGGNNDALQGDINYVDDEGEEVVYDEKTHRFKYPKTGEMLHSEFYPNYMNPYE